MVINKNPFFFVALENFGTNEKANSSENIGPFFNGKTPWFWKKRNAIGRKILEEKKVFPSILQWKTKR